MSNSRMQIDSPASLAIRAWLVEHSGTMHQIAAATDFGLSTVEKVVGLLRRAGEPEVRNVLKARKGPPPGPSRLERQAARLAARQAREAEEAAAVAQQRVEIIASALATRSPLEQAWGAQA